MRANIVEILIESGFIVNQEKLEKLRTYIPDARFKEQSDFKLNSWDSNFDKENPEKNEELAIAKYQEYLKNEYKEIAGYNQRFFCDINIFLEEFPNTKFKILGTKVVNIDIDSSEIISQREKAIETMVENQKNTIETMMKNFMEMSKNIAENLKVDTLNQKCDVHIGGGLLMTVNETLLLEDSCTDRLQSELNSGWRILAVCVQPDGRRPDYVLGRFNPDLNVGGSASR